MSRVDGRGIEYAESERLDQRPAPRIDLDDHHLAALVPGDRGDEHADRPAAEDDRPVTGGQLGPADVVHRDRRGFDERGVVQPEVGRQCDQLLGRTFQRRCRAPGVSTPLTVR